MRFGQTVKEVYQTLTDFTTPNPMQEDVWRALVEDDKGGLLLLAPTGSGKTEAVAVPGLALGRRTFVILPARSLVDDQVVRFEKMLQQTSAQDTSRPYALIVDTGARSERRAWSGGVPVGKPQPRHLYQGDIIVTTLDKFLYRFFGFGEPGKAYAFPLHIRYGLRRPLFCFDEAHSYDSVAWTNFRLLLRALYEKGLDVVAMTATMPPSFAADVDSFLDERNWMIGDNRAKLEAFTRRANPRRGLTYVPCALSEVPNKLVELAQEHHAPGRRTIVSVGTVRDAVVIYRRLDEALLYHGRLTGGWRRAVYDELKRREKGEGYLLVTTSAIEVGCDLDAHTLISQLCDPEQLLQRAGRCNRKGEMGDAQVIVVGNRIPRFLTSLSDEAQEAYVATLTKMSGGALDSAAVQDHIVKEPNPDYRVEITFRMLYEYVYEAAVENKGLHDKGLVITRSWEPSVALCTGIEADGRLHNPVQVSIERCATGSENALTPGCRVYKRTFDRRERRPVIEPLRYGGCAYLIDFIVEVPMEFDEKIGYAEVPKVFLRRGRWFSDPYKERLSYPLPDGKSAWLWYLAPLEPMESSDAD